MWAAPSHWLDTGLKEEGGGAGYSSSYSALHWMHYDLWPLQAPAAVIFSPGFTIALNCELK